MPATMQPDNETDRLLRVDEAAELLSISRSKLYLMIDSGKIRSVRLPGCGRTERGSRRIRLSDIRDLIERSSTLGPSGQ